MTKGRAVPLGRVAAEKEPFFITLGGHFGRSKRMKSGLHLPTSIAGNASLPFVISTEAQRSGEISVWMLFLGNVLRSHHFRD
jgi:hypothetical protein